MSDYLEMPLADKHRKKAIRRSFRDFLKRLNSVADEVDTVYTLGRVACAIEVLAKEFDPEGSIFSDASCESSVWAPFDAKLGMKNEVIDQWVDEKERELGKLVATGS